MCNKEGAFIHALPLIEVHRLSENNFIDDAVDVSNVVRIHFTIITSLDTNHADNMKLAGIILGHMVRLYKLYDSFLLLCCENRLEAANVFIRPICETAIKLCYFLTDTNNKDIAQYFIKSSLSYEKKLYEQIQKMASGKKHDKRGQSILASIEESFKKAGHATTDVNFKKDNDWLGKNNIDLFKIAEINSLLPWYEFLYRSGCHSIHGSWHELTTYHLLEEEKNHYEPILTYASARFDIIAVITILILEIAGKYLETYKVSDPELNQKIIILKQWYRDLFYKYEQFCTENN